ncbi:MAG: glucose 1-dehydrogenase [Pseudomonadales bacterium]|nr:glucose 1-dehydrogenase [Pseudomonadales bacterium]
MSRVQDKIAIITGGSSGIGRGCAIRLAEEGAKVAVTDIDEEMGAQTVDAIVAAGGTAMFLHHDVTQEGDWNTVVDHVVNTWGGLHILVNNAGIGIGGSILELSLADWQRQQAINLDGVFLGVRTAIPPMIESGYGSIVNMSSVAGLKGAATLSAYNATKGGVRLFTKGVALECANSRWPIRVNSVHPGIIDTPIWTKVNPDIFEAGENAVDIDQMALTGVPTGEVGYPSDIANGVLFLASEESRYITGTELVIDGGVSA